MKNLPYLRPSVFYTFGADSPLSSHEEQEKKVKRTGTAASGSGGATGAMVKGHALQGSGHLLVFDHLAQTARVAADGVKDWFDRWRADEKIIRAHESGKSTHGMLEVSKAWVDAVGQTSDTNKRRESKI